MIVIRLPLETSFLHIIYYNFQGDRIHHHINKKGLNNHNPDNGRVSLQKSCKKFHSRRWSSFVPIIALNLNNLRRGLDQMTLFFSFCWTSELQKNGWDFHYKGGSLLTKVRAVDTVLYNYSRGVNVVNFVSEHGKNSLLQTRGPW